MLQCWCVFLKTGKDDRFANHLPGVIIGPVLGGLLADPVAAYPSLFGKDSLFGGKTGVWWLRHWPYALPNLTSAIFLCLSASAVTFFLKETHESLEDRPDWGLAFGRSITNVFRRRRSTHAYQPLPTSDVTPSHSRHHSYELSSPPTPIPKPTKKPTSAPFRSILTPNVLITLLTHGLLALHTATFQSLWFIFLSAPRSTTTPHLPFRFSGGLALPPRTIGLALAILGTVGLTLQLALYPPITARLGTLRSFRLALICFPLVYTLAPFLAVVPSTSAPPQPASGPWLWVTLISVLGLQVLGRTFALPAGIILVNNCAPSKSVLGTVHGVALSFSSGMRTLGPVVGGWGFGKGLENGVVGGVWWGVAVVAVVGWAVSWGVREGGAPGEESEVKKEGEDRGVGGDGGGREVDVERAGWSDSADSEEENDDGESDDGVERQGGRRR